MRVTNKLAWQKGRIVQYAEIELEIVDCGEAEPTLSIPGWVGSNLANAIEFGANLFFENYSRSGKNYTGLTVSIIAIEAVPCDTTIYALAYVTFQAICLAFDINGDEVFSFDEITGRFALSLPELSSFVVGRA